MSAALLIASVWTLKPDSALDWEAGRRYIDSASIGDLDPDGRFDAEEEEDARGLAHEYLQAVHDYWTGKRDPRDITLDIFGPVRVLQSGGMSWGDDPTEAFREISNCPEGALKAVGFFDWKLKKAWR